MTREGAIALAGERREVLALGRTLTPDEWALPSGCAGWSVQDVFAHLSALFHPAVSTVKAFLGPDIERANDVLVEERSSWSPVRQLDEYERWSGRAVRILFGLQHRPVSAVPVPLGDLGRHPAHFLADAAAFDHYVHLRLDLLAPGGPLDRSPVVSDPLRLRPVIGWMLRLLLRLSADAIAALPGPVHLSLSGHGGGEWTIGGTAPDGVVRGVPADPVATVLSSTEAFPAWATRRVSWREADVAVRGDEQAAATFLDEVHVV